MIDVVVSLSMATICFLGQCHPVLVGNETPSGVFSFVHAKITEPGYGGDVLVFEAARGGSFYAAHRVWLGAPKQRRLERLRSTDPEVRKGITGGCINMAPEVYDSLVDCCSKGQVQIVQ